MNDSSANYDDVINNFRVQYRAGLENQQTFDAAYLDASRLLAQKEVNSRQDMCRLYLFEDIDLNLDSSDVLKHIDYLEELKSATLNSRIYKETFEDLDPDHNFKPSHHKIMEELPGHIRALDLYDEYDVSGNFLLTPRESAYQVLKPQVGYTDTLRVLDYIEFVEEVRLKDPQLAQKLDSYEVFSSHHGSVIGKLSSDIVQVESKGMLQTHQYMNFVDSETLKSLLVPLQQDIFDNFQGEVLRVEAISYTPPMVSKVLSFPHEPEFDASELGTSGKSVMNNRLSDSRNVDRPDYHSEIYVTRAIYEHLCDLSMEDALNHHVDEVLTGETTQSKANPLVHDQDRGR